MKQLYSLLLFVACSLTAAAKPITLQQAAVKADRMVRQWNADAELVPFDLANCVKARSLMKPFTDAAPFYAFNTCNNGGFVIIAGDDDFPAVVGYSDVGQFAPDNIPAALSQFLQAYAGYVEDVRNGKAAPPRRDIGDVISPTTEPVVAPMLNTQWGQGAPYNYYCPNQWPVGCAALAMAQIMNYWQFPESGVGSITYGTAGKNVSVNFAESHYDWSLMKKKFSSMDWKNDAGKNVAKLCFDCGVSCYMDYNQDGSGSTVVDVYNALFTHFRYNAEAIELYVRDAMADLDAWKSLIYAELDALRPILYAGGIYQSDYALSEGHAFILDGYDVDGLVHVNWGWNGNNDGYYDITLMNPGAHRFPDGQEMVIGIMPDENGEHTQRKQFRMQMTDPLTIGKASVVDLGANFNLIVGNLFNHGSYADTYTIAIMLYRSNGEFVQKASLDASRLIVTLSSGYGTQGGMVKCNVPADIADGDYYFCVETQQKGFDAYVKPFTRGGDVNNRVPAYIHDGQIFLNEVSDGIHAVSSDDEVIRSTRYFDLSGRSISPAESASQVIIRRDTYKDGSVRTTKIQK